MNARSAGPLATAVILIACSGPTTPSPAASVGPGESSPPASPSAAPSVFVPTWEPTGLGFDLDHNLVATDCIGGYVYRVDLVGGATVIAGTGVSSVAGGLGDEVVPALEADIHCPADVAINDRGLMYVVDHANNRIRVIDRNGLITTVIGSGPIGTGSDNGLLAGDGRPALDATLQEPWGIAFGPDGLLYFADRDNHAIRTVDSNGVIATMAGTGDRGFSGDGGLAIEAELSRPQGVAVDGDGNLFFSDADNHVIRRVDPSGLITTVVGTGEAGNSGDGGPGTQAQIADPTGMVFDADGNLYFVDDQAHVVRRVDLDGIISTVAGTGQAGFSGDGGPGTQAALNTPTDIAFDDDGNLFIADGGNHRIRVLRPDGRLETFSTGPVPAP
jgi:sugar lactone lactonase YvrE